MPPRWAPAVLADQRRFERPLVLLLMALFAFPLTYLPHRAAQPLRAVRLQPRRPIFTMWWWNTSACWPANHHHDVVSDGVLPIVLVYSISITNALDSFLIHQFHVALPPHLAESGGSGGALNLVLLRGKDSSIVAAMGMLVFPLLVFLMGISLYLMPSWNTANFVHGLAATRFDTPGLWHSLWLAVPVMVFSFSHAPIISSFASTQKILYGDKAERRCARASCATAMCDLRYRAVLRVQLRAEPVP